MLNKQEVGSLPIHSQKVFRQKKKISNTEENAGGEGGSDFVLTPKKKKKGAHSSVWNFFVFKPDNNEQGLNHT